MNKLMQLSDILRSLIRIPSVNPLAAQAARELCGESRVSDWLEEFLRDVGAPCERILVVPACGEWPARENVLSRFEIGTARPTILLDAHQDTVHVTGMAAPFEADCRDGRMYGRGACDVKGGMAAMLFAFARLFRERPAQAANVVLSCTCDEEATALGVRQLVSVWSSSEASSRLLSATPCCCIVAEPTELHVVRSHRGVLRFRVHTQGRACHASDPSQGVNAIYAMAPIVQALETMAVALARQSPGDAWCGQPTLSVGLISGGTAVNIVPDRCQIDVDRRLIPGEAPQKVWQEIRDRLEPFSPEVEHPWLKAPALDSQCNELLAERLLSQLHDSGHSAAQQLGVPYCTNASTIAASGVPAVVFGPGSIAQAHTVEEYIDMAQVVEAAEIYYRFCASYCE